MRVRMKFVVPLTMPMMRSMRSPASDSRSGRMNGMPPATAASNSRSTPGLLGRGEQIGADVGQQLLVAGDDRLARLERGEDELAGRLDAADDLDHHVDVGVDDHARGVEREDARRAARPGAPWPGCAPPPGSRRGRTPVRAAMASRRASMSSTRAAPTLPQPSRPMRTRSGVTTGNATADADQAGKRFTPRERPLNGRRLAAGRRTWQDDDWPMAERAGFPAPPCASTHGGLRRAEVHGDSTDQDVRGRHVPVG